MAALARLRFVLGLGLILCVLLAPGMTSGRQRSSGSLRDVIDDAHRWIKAGASRVAALELERALPSASNPSERKELLSLLMTASFNTQEYDDALRWADVYLGEMPSERERDEALYIRGVSGFQTGHDDIASISLERFFRGNPDPALAGKGHYWKGACELRGNNLSAAEEDFHDCLADSSAREYHDVVLMGLASLSERRGRFDEASEFLDRLLRDFPASTYNIDARIRSASLNVRRGNAMGALEIINRTKPQYSYQEEQSLLLRAQSEFLLDDFSNSRTHFKQYVERYPLSRQARTARLGLAWSLLRAGDTPGARREYVTLSAGTDSVAEAALYELAVIHLVGGNTADALGKFDTLVMKFPYGAYADQAYYQTGLIRYREQHYKDARRNFLYVVELFPESSLLPEAFRMSGECSMALHDFANAQYDFSEVQRRGAPVAWLAPSMFQEGVCLYHLGRFRSSALKFDEYLRKFPAEAHVAEAFVWRGEAEYQDYRFDEAAQSFAEGMRRFPDNPKREDAEYGAAWSYFEQKKFSQAADAFGRFITAHPASDRRLEAALRRADCYFFMGRYDQASEMYASLAAEKNSSQKSEYAAFQLAMSYVQRGDAERGIEQLRNFLARFPSSLYCEVARFNIGWIYFSNEHYPDAVTEFRLLQRQFPESQLMPRVLFNMGDAFYNLKQYDSARVYYQSVIEQYSTSPLAADALTGLQFTYQAQGKSTEALATIEKYLGSRPAGISTEELILKKGDLLFGQSDYEGAIHEYQRILALNPTRPVKARTYRQLGRSYEMLNNPQRAIASYEQVVGEFSETEEAPPCALALGITYMKLKQYPLAAKVLQDFDRRFPESPLVAEARYNLGLSLANASRHDEALGQFQSVIHQFPGDIFADRSRLQIALLHSARKEYGAAVDSLNVVINRRGDDVAAEALVLTGNTYLASRRYKDALQSFHDVVAQYKDYPIFVERAKFGTGECYEHLHEISNARSTYQEIVKDPVDPEIKKEAEKRLKRLHR